MKDDTIKHLNQHATMLEAQVHDLEAIKDKLEKTLEEREQELARAEEHITKLNRSADAGPMVQQRTGNIDTTLFESAGDQEALFHEVCSLRKENNSLKKRAEGLANEASSLRQSMSLAETNQNSDGSLPFISTQACMELETLHQVVDSLKSTVIQQRSYLLKMKAPQTPASLPAKPIDAGPEIFQDFPCLRQGEEKVAASSYSDPFDFSGASSAKCSSPSKTSALADIGTLTGSASEKNAQEPVRHLAGKSTAFNLQHQRWPLRPATSGVGVCVMDAGKGQVGAVATSATPEGAYDPVNSNLDSLNDTALPHSPRECLNTDRLCPVCNQDFGSLSIDQFQSHVLECFDSENGSEAIASEDLTLQGVCPVCGTGFGDRMSQSEFEKHVHSHFGEDLPD